VSCSKKEHPTRERAQAVCREGLNMIYGKSVTKEDVARAQEAAEKERI